MFTGYYQQGWVFLPLRIHEPEKAN